MRMRIGVLIVLAAAALPVVSPHAAGERWHQWRGPSRTGVIPIDDAPAMWPAELRKGWTADIGEGYSSPIASDGRVFVHARRDPDEVVSAIDIETGKTVWSASYPAPAAKNPYARQMAKGPYATPLVADGRLFTIGTTAIISAWNVSTGALLWRKDFSDRVDMSKLFCGTAASPLQTASGILFHIGDDRGGSMLALDPATGKEKWTTSVKGPGYASPIELSLAGTRQLVTMTTGSIVGVDTSTGQVLWEFPFEDEWNENIVTPIAMGDGVIVSGVRQGTRRLNISKPAAAWEAKQVWHTPDVAMYMSSPVLAGGTLFGHSSRRKGQFVAVDPETGAIKWSTEGRNATSASVVAAGRHLLFSTTESQLIVSPMDSATFEEIRRYTIASSPVYAHPIVLRDRVIIRDATNVTEWRTR